ncbi:MAG: NAD-dependent epimerase/dehydratase family protein [Verrucomicrobiota bacterium]
MNSFWRDKSVLVTGGTGFLGTHVCQQLRSMHAKAIIIPKHRDYDLTRETDVRRLFNQYEPDVVIHLAGLVGGILPNRERPAEFFYQNLMIGTLMMHYAWKSGVKRFVAAGAGCGYPEFAPKPLREADLWSGFPQKESAPYSLAKRMLAIQSDAYFRQYGFIAVICIPGNIYGPYDNFNLLDAHVIPALVRKFVEAAQLKAPAVEVWGSGRAARDFVYVGDAAKGLLRAAERINCAEVINLSGGEEIAVRKVVAMLKTITGYSGKIVWNRSRPDGQLHRRFDTSKARRLLKWEAQTTLREGLCRTVAWYRAHQDEARK